MTRIMSRVLNHHRLTNCVRRTLLRFYYSKELMLPCCLGKAKRLHRPTKLQILVLGNESAGKTTFCLNVSTPVSVSTKFDTFDDYVTKSNFSERMVLNSLVKKRLFASPVAVKYIEAGWKDQGVIELYARSHAIILMLDLSTYPCSLHVLDDMLQTVLHHKNLTRKPILIVGSKFDACPIVLDLLSMTEEFQLEKIASAYQTRMMTMICGKRTKMSEILTNLDWFVGQVLRNEPEISERIGHDLEELKREEKKQEAHAPGRHKAEAILTHVVELEESKDNVESEDEIEEIFWKTPVVKVMDDEHAHGEGVMKDETKDDQMGRSESEAESGETVIEVETRRQPTPMEPSWIEELTGDIPDDDDDVEDLPATTLTSDHIPLHRVSGKLNLFNDDYFTNTDPTTPDDVVYPFTVFEFTTLKTKIGESPDFFSTPVDTGSSGEPDRNAGKNSYPTL